MCVLTNILHYLLREEEKGKGANILKRWNGWWVLFIILEPVWSFNLFRFNVR